MAAPPWNPDHPLLGRLLAGRFQIASFIREGGMAQVFCAMQDAEPRHVAIKVMHPELAEDPEIVARFIREARTAERLKHPNIVRILSVSEDRELLFMAMELLFGDDLSARVKLKGSFTEERSAEIIVDVLAALQHAHEQGVIHRDIKPENVMLARQPDAPEKEVVKVLDFGIAKILDARPDVELPSEAPTHVRSVLTRVGTWVGTPAYMSPEQGSALAIDHRSDVYSAGVLLFELVCGKPPFEGQTPLQILARHIHDPVPRPSSLTTLHPQLEAILLRALEKDPNRRFQSAREMGDAILQVLPDLSIASSERWAGRTQAHPGPDGQRLGVAATMAAAVAPPADPRAAPRAPAQPAGASVPARVRASLAAEGRSASELTMPSARDGEVEDPTAALVDGAQSRRVASHTVMLELPQADAGASAQRPTHPLIGRMLAERYHVASFIREGSMAQVFCGLQDEEPRHVAIKVVHPELADDKAVVGRFLREAQLAVRLRHPNIVRVIDVGEDDQLLFMVMELLFGDDLSARIKQRGSFDQARAVQIAVEVCQALDHAHAQGIVHRDVKPENIMLCRMPDAPTKEVVKVLDFGIAKVLDATDGAGASADSPTGVRSVLTRVGSLVGTPAYMSPEQGRAEPVDHRSDLYSVGVLLYELLCGKPPFEGETALQIVARHVHQPPPPPSSLAPVPKALEAVVLRALAKRPEDRPQSARELAEALESALGEAPKSTGSGAASDRWLRRTGRGVALPPAVPATRRSTPEPAPSPSPIGPSSALVAPGRIEITQAAPPPSTTAIAPAPGSPTALQTPVVGGVAPSPATPGASGAQLRPQPPPQPPAHPQPQPQAQPQAQSPPQAHPQAQAVQGHPGPRHPHDPLPAQQPAGPPTHAATRRAVGTTQPLHDVVAALNAARAAAPSAVALAPAAPAPPTPAVPSARDPRVERLIRLVAVLVVLLGVAFAVILALVLRSLR